MTRVNKFKLLAGYSLGSVAYGYCLLVAWTVGPGPYLQVLLCIFGGVLGWIIGIAITPSDVGEKKLFSDFAKGFSALISGIVIAKIDAIFQSPVVTNMLASDSETLLQRTLLVCTCLMIGMLFTFIARRYLRDPEDEKAKQRAKIVGEVRTAVEKLSSLN